MIENVRSNKIIVVAYPVGRIDPSAIMGLLKIADISVGNRDGLSKAAPMNPKGILSCKIGSLLLQGISILQD